MAHFLRLALSCCFLLLTAVPLLQAKEARSYALEGFQPSRNAFVENRGQLADSRGRARPDVLYYAHLPGGSVYLLRDRVAFALDYGRDSLSGAAANAFYAAPRFDDTATVHRKLRYRLDLHFEGSDTADLHTAMVGAQHHKVNYYYGHCPDGVRGVRSARQVVYRDLYPGIDVVFRITADGRLKYDYRLDAEASLSDLRLRYEGATGMRTLEDGRRLQLDMHEQNLEEHIPAAYTAAGEPLEVRYQIQEGETRRVRLVAQNAEAYTHQAWVIDPKVEWSAGIGDATVFSFNNVFDLYKDSLIYFGGSARSFDQIPITSGAFDTSFTNEREKAYFGCVGQKSKNAKWITYFGGGERSTTQATVIRTSDSAVYIAGSFRSRNSSFSPNSYVFPTTSNAFLTSNSNGFDGGWIAKFDHGGNRQYATFLNGGVDNGFSRNFTEDNDHTISDFCIIRDNQLAIVGNTNDSTYKLSNKNTLSSFSSRTDRYDYFSIFYIKDSIGTSVGLGLNSRGFNNTDIIRLAPDSQFVISGNQLPKGGNTTITSDAYQKQSLSGNDVFWGRVDSNGNWDYLTYFDGVSTISDIEVDDSNNVYLNGDSFGALNQKGPDQRIQSSATGFNFRKIYLAKFSQKNTLVWSYLYESNGFGSSMSQNRNEIALVYREELRLGQKFSFPATADAVIKRQQRGSRFGALMLFDTSGVLNFASLYGGIGNTFFSDVVFGKNNNAYVLGSSTYEWLTDTSITSGVSSGEILLEIGCNAEPEVTRSAPTACRGDSITLTAAPGFSTYKWSRGDSATRSITIGKNGDYYVEVTDSNGCTGASDVDSLRFQPAPTSVFAVVNGPIDLCKEDTATIFGPTGYESYRWTNGDTTSLINTNQPGRYAVTVTNSLGCSATSNTVRISRRPDPNPQISGGDLCQGGTVTLDAGSGYASYRWSTGQTTQSIQISQIDTYWVEVANSFGCIGRDTIVPGTRQGVQPVLSLQRDTALCTGDAITLRVSNASSFSSFSWADASTDSTYRATAGSGLAYVQTRDLNGCIGRSDSVRIKALPLPREQIQAGGATRFCQGGQVTLSVPAGYTAYRWSDGQTTTRSLTASASDSFSVTLTDQNGCTATSDTVAVLVDPNPTPSLQVLDSARLCRGDTARIFTAQPYARYSWSNATAGDTLRTTQAGSYSVTVTDQNGCSGSSSGLSVSVLPRPSVSIDTLGQTGFCDGDSVILSVGGGFSSYRWSTGSRDTAITVRRSGRYGVEVTNALNCPNQPPEVAVQVGTQPAVTQIGPDSVCLGDSVRLEVDTSLARIAWNTGDSSARLIVDTTGRYFATTTDTLGCTFQTDTNFILAKPLQVPSPTISAGGSTTFCEGGSLTVLAPNGFARYRWSDGQKGQSATFDSTGDYQVTVFDQQGCRGSSNALAVTVFPNPSPQIVVDTNRICEGDSARLTTARSYTAYNWSNQSTADTQYVRQNASLGLTVTDRNGCTGAAGAVTISVLDTPDLQVTAASRILCRGDSTLLDAGRNYTRYRWADGDTTRRRYTARSQPRQVTVTNLAGCSASGLSPSITLNGLPDASVDTSGPTRFCAGDSVVLQARSSGLRYRWARGDTSRAITVRRSGSYRLVAINANGCRDSSQAFRVQVDPLPREILQVGGKTTFCDGDSVRLAVPDGYASYRWSDASTDTGLYAAVSGAYFVRLTDARGCVGFSDTVSVNVKPLPAASLSILGDTLLCRGDSAVFEGPSGSAAYRWSNGDSTRRTVIRTTTNVQLQRFGRNGCAAASRAVPVQVFANPEPQLIASGPARFCADDTTRLFLNGSFTGRYRDYQWSNSRRDSVLIPRQDGDYFVQVTDTNGCSGVSDTVGIQIDPLPEPRIQFQGPATFCEPDSLLLSANANFQQMRWGDGRFGSTIVVRQSGRFALEVVDSNGCSATSDTQAVTVNRRPDTTVRVTGSPAFCAGDSVILEAREDASGVAYRWSNGDTSARIVVRRSRTGLRLEVETPQGCRAVSAPRDITRYALPQPQLSESGPVERCAGDRLALTTLSNYAAYEWSHGPRSALVQLARAGDYVVEVTDTNGCRNGSDTLRLSINPLPEPRLNADGPLTFCAGDNVRLGVNQAYEAYQWSDGRRSAAIRVDTSGTYQVTVTDANGCEGTSSEVQTQVFALPQPRIRFAEDTVLCSGDSVLLETASDYVDYAWNNGASGRRLFVRQGGVFEVQVTDLNGCENTAPLFRVEEQPSPRARLSVDDQFICPEDSLTITTSARYADYRWSNDLRTASITATTSGDYFAEVTNELGCSGPTDTVRIGVYPAPQPEILPSGIQQICEGQQVTYATARRYIRYLWSTGSRAPDIEVDQAGAYEVLVVDENGCQGRAFTDVVVNARPQLDTLVWDGSALVARTGSPFTEARWTRNGARLETRNNSLAVQERGRYAVVLLNEAGCTSDTARYNLPFPVGPGEVTVFPTRVQDEVFVALTVAGDQEAQWRLMTSHGQELQRGTARLTAGTQRIRIPVADFRAQMMYLEVEVGGAAYRKKLLKE